MLKLNSIILFFCLIIVSCTPSPNLENESSRSDYINMLKSRSQQFHSAADLIDLRVNDGREKFSVITELYFAGDSVGFYGRGYLGKGTFKGAIIDGTVTVYFRDANEYFQNSIDKLNLDADCARPGEVLFYVLSLLSGNKSNVSEDKTALITKNKLEYHDKRFYRTVYLKNRTYPKREKLIDPACGDSIMVRYMSFDNDFPYYRVRDILYHNEPNDFRAKGFIREQKFNIDLPERKFRLNIPADAVRIDSF